MTELVHVVDDEEKIRNLIRDALAFEGYEIETFADGTSFLEAAANRRPDVVLLDLKMPDPDGWEVAAEMREREEDPPPMLAVTAILEPGDEPVPGETSDFDAIVQKPFRLEELKDVVAEHVGRPA